MILKIGVPLPGRAYSIKNGKFSGTSAAFVSKNTYLPRNSYLVDPDELKDDIVGALEGKVDFIRQLPNLQSLPTNITTGPVYMENQCYLMAMQPIKSHLKAQKFEDSFQCFDILAWVFVFLLTLVLIHILRLAARNSLNTISWKCFGTFFQGYITTFPKWMSFKLTLATILAWFLIIKIVYLSSIHTDMIVIDAGGKIETFEDVIAKNFSMTETGFLSCLRMLDNDARFSEKADRAARLIKREAESDPLLNGWYNEVTNITYLSSLVAAQTFQGIFCYFPHSMEARQRMKPHISKKPAINQNSISFFSLNLSPERKERIHKYFYSYLEQAFNIYELSIGSRLIRNFRQSDPDLACTSDQPPSVTLEPLSLAFLSDTFTVYYILCFISIIIFCLEHIHVLI